MADEIAVKKKCFVVMGFGEKTDFQTQRVLDLDKTYRIIIKKAVEDAGLECIRADEVMHAGIIDKPMYELLLEADVVVADLSTSNPNAIYELGVRHALRPNTTIVIAESEFKFPFDIGHLLVRPYEHLGKGIDAEEAERVRGELTAAIQHLLQQQETDSPVYTFLPGLQPPAVAQREAATASRGATPEESSGADGATEEPPPESMNQLMKLFQDARQQGEFLLAREILKNLRDKSPNDPYFVQQHALATYKSKQPDAKTSLVRAREILENIGPRKSNDSETLGLWGAIHKRLWELDGDAGDLEEAIRSYGKGFTLRDDHYNGINFAFLLNVRASISEQRQAIADTVQAERVRKRVIELCEEELEAGVKDDDGNVDKEATFWLRATLTEALIGTGDPEKAAEMKAEALASAPETWMTESMNEQIAKLELLLKDAP